MLGERAAKGILAAASKSQLFTISHNISEVHVVPCIFNNKTPLVLFIVYDIIMCHDLITRTRKSAQPNIIRSHSEVKQILSTFLSIDWMLDVTAWNGPNKAFVIGWKVVGKGFLQRLWNRLKLDSKFAIGHFEFKNAFD